MITPYIRFSNSRSFKNCKKKKTWRTFVSYTILLNASSVDSTHPPINPVTYTHTHTHTHTQNILSKLQSIPFRHITCRPIPVAAKSKVWVLNRTDLLGFRVRIPPTVWLSVSCVCCVWSGREVSASGRSQVQRSSTECGVCRCV